MSRRTRGIVKALGDEIRAERVRLGWSRAEFARRITPTMPANTLDTYEKGRRQPPLERLMDICEALGVGMPELLSRAVAQPLPTSAALAALRSAVDGVARVIEGDHATTRAEEVST